MGQALAIVGVIVLIVALLIHFVIKGLSLFPHASLIIGVIGVIVLAVGVFFMMRPGAAK